MIWLRTSAVLGTFPSGFWRASRNAAQGNLFHSNELSFGIAARIVRLLGRRRKGRDVRAFLILFLAALLAIPPLPSPLNGFAGIEPAHADDDDDEGDDD